MSLPTDIQDESQKMWSYDDDDDDDSKSDDDDDY